MAEARYTKVASVEEALTMLAQAGAEGLLCAGGTDVLASRKQGLEQRRHLIDLSGVRSLSRISAGADGLVIGALATLEEAARSGDVAAWCPMLVEAAEAVASPTLRYTATVGGNLLVRNRCTFYNQSTLWRESAGSCLREEGDICLATGGTNNCYSRNVSDVAPACIALDADVEIQGISGTTHMPVAELYTHDGLQAQSGLARGAVLTAIRLSRRPLKWFYRKLRQRESVEFTSLTAAGARFDRGIVRVCVNGMSPAPAWFELDIRTTPFEKLQSLVRRACKTVDNDVMPLAYRRAMMDVYLEDLWSTLATSQ